MKDKVVLITGAASGIGKATAELYAKEGAKVILSDIQDAQSIVDNINANGGKAFFIKANVSVPEEMKNLVNAVIKTFGQLDIAVNNAGISGEQNAVADMSIEGWENIIKVNLSSVFYCMKYQIQEMLKQGSGSIINVSSILGSVGFSGAAGYSSTKHALIGLTQTAALEYSSKNIRINAIGPAFIETPLLKDLNDEIKKFLISQHPIGRLGKSEEVAELILWLGSDKASFVTGSYYPIDGGYLAR